MTYYPTKLQSYLIQRVDAYGELVDSVEVVALHFSQAVDRATSVMDYRNHRGGFVVGAVIPPEGFPEGYRVPYEDALARYTESGMRECEARHQEWYA